MSTNNAKFVVFPCATQQGAECFPCLGIDYTDEDGQVRSTFKHVRERGTYTTLDAAMEAARKIKVRSVSAEGVIVIEPA